MPQCTPLMIAPCHEGLIVRIDGRGTLNESPALRDTVRAVLDHDPETIVLLDLDSCTYLDSTLLGCLIGLHREYSLSQQQPRFQIVAGYEARQRLLAPMRLDSHLAIREALPQDIDAWFPIESDRLDLNAFGRHVMECHSRLAEAGVPKAAAFRQVADQLARELAAR